MTLKEKFKKQLDTATPTLNRPYYQASQLVQIADEFAIEFGKWLNNKVINPNGKNHNLAGNNYVDQLLLIFKKEKGL